MNAYKDIASINGKSVVWNIALKQKNQRRQNRNHYKNKKERSFTGMLVSLNIYVLLKGIFNKPINHLNNKRV